LQELSPHTTNLAALPPKPIAQIDHTSGNKIEFYNFGRAVLVMESGLAYNSPVVSVGNSQPNSILEIWNEVAPSTPPPQNLVELQHQLNNLTKIKSSYVGDAERDSGPVDTQSTSEFFIQTAKVPELGAQSPVGCNNGCCDFAWMSSTFWECGSLAGSFPYNWLGCNSDTEAQIRLNSWA
jgi:hypothetical protein